MRLRRRIVLAVVVAAALAGCAGPRGTTFPCPAVARPQLLLIYPAPGATAVPDAPGSMVFIASGGLSLVPPAGAAIPLAQRIAVPSPLPSPNAQPTGSSPSNDVAYASPTLAPATQYTVDWTDTPGPCSAGTVTLGSFTTQ